MLFKNIREYLRRVLGLEELQERVHILEAQRAGLEALVISTQETRALIRQSAQQADLSYAVKQHLGEIGISITDSSSDETLRVMEAAEVVERYGFRRFIPPVEMVYPSRVISLKDFQEHPELYWHKLSKGAMGFPVGLNFKGVNKILGDLFGNCEISMDTPYSNNGVFQFVLWTVLGKIGEECREAERREANAILVQAAELSDLTISRGGNWVYIDPLDFLANHDGLVRFIAERPDLDAEAKQRGIQAMGLARLVYLTALEIVGTTRIRDTSELLYYQPREPTTSEETALPAELREAGSLKQRIRDSLLTEPKGTSYKEIQKLLSIRSRERFRQLAGERTTEILSRDTERRGLTHRIGKDLRDYSIGECVVLASYFARNIIQNYQTLDDAVKMVLSGEKQDQISGKCTDYAGLALHYLREYLVPLHPEKFEGWHFGIESEQIGDWKHSYMKAIHVNPDGTVDVYFIDPTLLSQQGISGLKTPEEVMKLMDTANHPLLIERDAEDLLHKTI